MICKHFDDINLKVEAAIRASLPSDAAPIKLAIAWLSQGSIPIRAAITDSLTERDGGIALGAALELMNLAIHRLHHDLDDVTGQSRVLGVGVAGDVLVGDYLCTGAFRLLVECGDMEVMRVIASAVQRSCEAELENSSQLTAAHADFEVVMPISRLAAPLGEAAGLAATVLSGYGAAAGVLGARFGKAASVAQALAASASAGAFPINSQLIFSAHDALEQARMVAGELYHLTGNLKPLELCSTLEMSFLPDRS